MRTLCVTIFIVIMFVGSGWATINVRDFGAVGDGSTDDTQAFRDAFTSGDPDIYIPPGTYLIGDTTPVDFPDGRNLFGDGDSSILLVKTGTGILFQMSSNTSLFAVLIDGTRGSSGGVDSGLIELATVSNAAISSVKFVNCNRPCVMTDHTTALTVSNCSFTDVYMATSYIFSHQIETLNNTVVNAQQHGFQFWGNWQWIMKDCSDLVFSGNHITNGGAGAIWGTGARNVIITDNYVDGALDIAYDLEWCEDGVIANNFARRCETACAACFYSCERIHIFNNIFWVDREDAGDPTEGVWLTPTNTSEFPGDVGHSDVSVQYNTIVIPAGMSGTRMSVWVGSAYDNVVVCNNTINDTLNADIWYGGWWSWMSIEQPVLLPGMTMPLSCLGDFEPDEDVDLYDFAVLASAWMSRPGDDNWNSECDISLPADDTIDMADIAVFAETWLTHYSLPPATK